MKCQGSPRTVCTCSGPIVNLLSGSTATMMATAAAHVIVAFTFDPPSQQCLEHEAGFGHFQLSVQWVHAGM
ncbi:hypothetical protein ABBQ32_001597 [Trebouxia sp. C0010 RCD-2024]